MNVAVTRTSQGQEQPGTVEHHQRANWVTRHLPLILRGGAIVTVAVAVELWPRTQAGYGLSFSLWVLGIAAYAASFPRAAAALPRPTQATWLLLLAILATAATVRLYELEGVPLNISIDEIIPGVEALHIAQGATANVFSSLGWFAMPNMSFTFAAIMLKLGGADAFFALRLSSVLMGLGGIACTFLLARRLLGDRAGLVASFLMTASFWHLHNSRTGFPFVQSSFWPALVLYLLVRACQDRSRAVLALSGIALGVALQCYFPVRILIVVYPLFLFAYWWQDRGTVRRLAGDATIVALGTLFVLAPLLVSVPLRVLIEHSAGVLMIRPDRWRDVAALYRAGGVLPMLQYSFATAATMFTMSAEVCVLNRSPAGLLDIGTLGALIAGLLAAVLQGRLEPLLLVVWAALTFVFGVALTDAPRASYRLAAAMPALFILGAFGVEQLLQLTPPRRWYRLTVRPLLLGALAAWILAENTQMFFVDYARLDGRDNPDSAARRLLLAQCDGRQFYFIGDWQRMRAPVSEEPQALELFCAQHLPLMPDQIPLRVNPTQAATFMLLDDPSPAAGVLRRCYPRAQVTQHTSIDGRFMFTSVDVSAADLSAASIGCGRGGGLTPPEKRATESMAERVERFRRNAGLPPRQVTP